MCGFGFAVAASHSGNSLFNFVVDFGHRRFTALARAHGGHRFLDSVVEASGGRRRLRGFERVERAQNFGAFGDEPGALFGVIVVAHFAGVVIEIEIAQFDEHGFTPGDEVVGRRRGFAMSRRLFDDGPGDECGDENDECKGKEEGTDIHDYFNRGSTIAARFWKVVGPMMLVTSLPFWSMMYVSGTPLIR